MQISLFPSPFLLYSMSSFSFTIIPSAKSPPFIPYHPCSLIFQPPLLSASARDAIAPADLRNLNDACKLLLSIPCFIYLLTNYYPWCLTLCCTVCVHIKVALRVCVRVSSDWCNKVPEPLLVQPALSVYLRPLNLGGMLTLWPVRHIHMHDYTHQHILSGYFLCLFKKKI